MITFGPAWMKKVGALHVVKLKGSFYEMGRLMQLQGNGSSSDWTRRSVVVLPWS